MLMPVTVLIILAFPGSVRVEASIEGGPLESVWLNDFVSRYALFAATVLTLALTEMLLSMSVLVPGPTAVIHNPNHSCDMLEIDKTLARWPKAIHTRWRFDRAFETLWSETSSSKINGECRGS